MKIGTLGTVKNPLDRRGVAPELRSSLAADTTLVGFPSRVPAFPFTPVEQAMQQLGHLDAAFAATAQGCDAVVIDSVGDYGLPAIRAALDIPAIGAGEAGMMAASAGGRRFAIVTVWPASMNFIVKGLLRSYAIEQFCTAIRNVGEEGALDSLAGPDGYLAQIRDGQDGIVARVVAAVYAETVAGAEAVMLGCTCMSPIAARVQAACGVPVINPLAEGVRRAEALARSDIRTPAGLRPGRDALVARMVDAVADETPEDCPVCVFAEE